MVAEHTLPDITWQGSEAEQDRARQIFELIRAQGMFASDYAPIQVRLDALAGATDTTEDTIRTAVASNLHVFKLHEDDDTTWVISTRLGRPPITMAVDTLHSFAERLLTPEPAPERPLRTEREAVEPGYQSEVSAALEHAQEEELEVEQELRTEGVAFDENFKVELVTDPAEREAVRARREAREEAAEEAARPKRAAAVEPEETAPVEAEPELEVEAEPEEAAPVEAEVEPVVEAAVAEAVAAALETKTEEAIETEPEVPEPAEAPVAETEPEPEAPAEVEPEAPAVTLTDLGDYDDAAVATAITEAITADSRFVNFADRWMAEDRVDRLSRGNLRGLADYINEQEQPLTDDVLVQDVLGVRRSSSEFELARFSMNYRLQSERNFDFLGTRNQPFWGTSDLPSIGTTRRKANDIGTDYRYLVDEVPEGSVEPRSVSSVEHTLSFYEFVYGLLPLDARMQALLPAPMMPDQRSAVLMVEIPQFENSVYLVEVRYPTHNRGGFILGLDDFYEEKLVPGAMLSISATDNDGQYKIEYLEDTERQDRFLELDDRRAPKYVFRPLSYDTAVDSDWLVTEDRFPALGNEKPLADKQRRHLDQVLETTFRRIGEDDGGKLIASFSDLLVAVNVERPASEALLKATIESMPSVTEDDAGIVTYDPSA